MAITGLTVPGYSGAAPTFPSFTVAPTPAPPAVMVAPTLVSPVANPTLSTLTPTLQWSGGAAAYWQVNIRHLTTDVLTPSAPLPPGQMTNDPATYRVSQDGYFTTASAPAPTSPDLRIEGATVNTPTVTAGGIGWVGFNIFNRGNATAAASVVSIRINQSTTSEVGTEVARASVAALQLQQGFNFSATPFVAPTVPGVYQIWMVADVDKVSGQDTAASANDTVRATSALTVVAAPAPVGPPTVSGLTCVNAVVGQTMTCTITGSNIGQLNIAASVVNITAPGPVCPTVTQVGMATATQRSFTCVPAYSGRADVQLTDGETGGFLFAQFITVQ